MYPNPQDVLPLPPRPSLEHYKKRAKDLAKAGRDGDDAIGAWADGWVHSLLASTTDLPGHAPRDAARRAAQVAAFARERLAATDRTLAQAQFVIARAHGFASWPRFSRHLADLATQASGSATFERAADAIVAGDLDTLRRLLAADPSLVHARSSREHGATLLHYVAANGVENYRQRTPMSIVAIAQLLLDLDADVDAEADVYGGGATTLGLTVTSAHPREAGVQIALADLLLARGARLDARVVRSCLMNGCPEAAAHLATLGAPFGLEEAAGIARLDVLARHFEGAAVPSAEAAKALMMASWYDRLEIVAYLLNHDVDVAARAPDDECTALHIAAYQGHVALVELLLARGAPREAVDGRYGTTPLAWATHAWRVDQRGPADAYERIVGLLCDSSLHT